MVTLFVMRHGITQMNKDNLIMGHIDSPLLDNKERIKKLAKLLQTQTPNLKKIYSSDLGRAHNTAKQINEQLEFPLIIELDSNLREINYGEAANESKTNIEIKYPLHKIDAGFKYPSGESFNELYQRVISFIESIKNSKGSYLIITHAGAIRAIISYMKDEPFQKNLKIKLSHDILIRCEIDENKKYVEFINP